MKNKKYIVFPGYVRSKVDGDLHFVNADELISLYKVDPELCIKFNKFLPMKDLARMGLIELGPRYDGNYSLYR